jgi:threonine/homoserine/homoserine lactone efflux protein
MEAAAFQWLNPKGWVMAVGATSAYAAVADFPANMALMAFLFGSFGILSSATWLGFGTGLKRLLTNPRTVRAVNIAMALLLVASLWPIASDAWR